LNLISFSVFCCSIASLRSSFPLLVKPSLAIYPLLSLVFWVYGSIVNLKLTPKLKMPLLEGIFSLLGYATFFCAWILLLLEKRNSHSKAYQIFSNPSHALQSQFLSMLMLMRLLFALP
jgi:hypothetical protein